MKTFAFTAALLFSTAAIAQTQPAPMPPGGPDTTTTPAPDSTTPPSSTTNDGMAPAPTAPAPAAPAPMADPMPQQQPAMPQQPMSTRMQPGMAPTGDSAAPAATAQASYPRCSATVTDQCRQGSARESDRKGGPRKRRG